MPSSQGMQTIEFMVKLKGHPAQSLTRFESDLWIEERWSI